MPPPDQFPDPFTQTFALAIPISSPDPSTQTFALPLPSVQNTNTRVPTGTIPYNRSTSSLYIRTQP